MVYLQYKPNMKLSGFVFYFAATAVASTNMTSDKPGYHSIGFNVYRGNHHSDVTKRDTSPPHYMEKVKGDGSMQMSLQNRETFYAAELKVGSQKEENFVIIDMLSSDTWFIDKDVCCLTGAGNNYTSCAMSRTFDANSSTSSRRNSSSHMFKSTLERFAHQTFGYWVTDTVNIGDTPVLGSFAVVNFTNSVSGILGLRRSANEITAYYRIPYEYDNFPLRLKALGMVHSIAYSLYSSYNYEPIGTILFWAIDHAKYIGDLVILPTCFSFYMFFYVQQFNFTSVYLDRGKEVLFTSQSTDMATLGPYSSVTYFADDLLTEFAKALNAT